MSHPPLEAEKENKHPQQAIKPISRSKTLHHKPLGVVNSFTNLPFKSSSTVGSCKMLPTNYQKYSLSACSTPASLQKNAKQPNTSCIVDEQLPNTLQLQQDKNLLQKLNTTFTVEQQDVTPSEVGNISSLVNDDAITEYINTIIQNQLDILQQDEVYNFRVLQQMNCESSYSDTFSNRDEGLLGNDEEETESSDGATDNSETCSHLGSLLEEYKNQIDSYDKGLENMCYHGESEYPNSPSITLDCFLRNESRIKRSGEDIVEEFDKVIRDLDRTYDWKSSCQLKNLNDSLQQTGSEDIVEELDSLIREECKMDKWKANSQIRNLNDVLQQTESCEDIEFDSVSIGVSDVDNWTHSEQTGSCEDIVLNSLSVETGETYKLEPFSEPGKLNEDSEQTEGCTDIEFDSVNIEMDGTNNWAPAFHLESLNDDSKQTGSCEDIGLNSVIVEMGATYKLEPSSEPGKLNEDSEQTEGCTGIGFDSVNIEISGTNNWVPASHLESLNDDSKQTGSCKDIVSVEMGETYRLEPSSEPVKWNENSEQTEGYTDIILNHVSVELGKTYKLKPHSQPGQPGSFNDDSEETKSFTLKNSERNNVILNNYEQSDSGDDIYEGINNLIIDYSEPPFQLESLNENSEEKYIDDNIEQPCNINRELSVGNCEPSSHDGNSLLKDDSKQISNYDVEELGNISYWSESQKSDVPCNADRDMLRNYSQQTESYSISKVIDNENRIWNSDGDSKQRESYEDIKLIITNREEVVDNGEPLSRLPSLNDDDLLDSDVNQIDTYDSEKNGLHSEFNQTECCCNEGRGLSKNDVQHGEADNWEGSPSHESLNHDFEVHEENFKRSYNMSEGLEVDDSEQMSLFIESNINQVNNADPEKFGSISCKSESEESVSSGNTNREYNMNEQDNVCYTVLELRGAFQPPFQCGNSNKDSEPCQIDTCDIEEFDNMSHHRESNGSSCSFQRISLCLSDDVYSDSCSASPEWHTCKSDKITTWDMKDKCLQTNLTHEIEDLTAAKPQRIMDSPHSVAPVNLMNRFSQTSRVDEVSHMAPKNWQDHETCTTPVESVTMVDKPVNGTSPAMDSRASQMTPILFKEFGTCTTPPPEIFFADTSTNVTPNTLVDVFQMTLKYWQERESSTRHVTDVNSPALDTKVTNVTPKTFMDENSQITPNFCQEQETSITPVENVKMVDEAVTITPPAMNSRASQMTPVSFKESCICTTPLPEILFTDVTPKRLMDEDSQMTPNFWQDQETCTTSIEGVVMVNEAVYMTPIPMNNMASQMTPVSSVELGTCTTPPPKIFFSDNSTNVTPKMSVNGISQMTPKYWHDHENCTTPVGDILIVDEAIYTTPIAMNSSASQVTSHSIKDQSTSTTPHQVSDAMTCTSPLVNLNLIMEQSGTHKDHVLLGQLQTATICNEILRKDIEVLESKMNGMKSQVKEKELDVIQATNDLIEKEQYFKSSHQKTVDCLQVLTEKQAENISTLEKDLSEKSAKIDMLEAEISSMRIHYQKQIQNLQQDLCRAYRQHKAETERMKEEINKNINLKDELLCATEHVEELQEHLKSFSQLKGALEEEAHVQEDLECLNDYYAGLEVLVREMEDECQKYKEENLMMKIKMEENDKFTSNALQNIKESNEQISELKMELELTEFERSHLDDLYSKASLELGLATQQYTDFLVELEDTKAEVKQYKNTLHVLKKQQDLQDQKTVESCLNEICLEASLIVQTNETSRQQVENQTLITELHSDNEELNQKFLEIQSVHEVEVQNLQSKVDELSEENHQNQERIACQLQEIRANFQVKAQLFQANKSIQKMEAKFKESQEFVEEECKALNETLKEKEAECQAVNVELSRYKLAFCNKLEDMEELQEALSVLRQQLADCESELDNTKASANLMLLNQLSEMADASNEIASLQSHMAKAYNSLMISENPQSDQLLSAEVKDMSLQKIKKPQIKRQTEGTDGTQAAKSPDETLPPEASLVASILNAINGSKEESNEETSCGSEQGGKLLSESLSERSSMGSNFSAFTAVKPQRVKDTEINAASDSYGTSHVESDQNTSTETKESLGDSDRMSHVDSGQNTSTETKESLGDFARATSALFGELLSAMKNKQVDVENKTAEIIIEKQTLENLMKKTINYYNTEHEKLNERLYESECQEQCLHQKLKDKMSKLDNQSTMMAYGQQQLAAMATKLDRLSDRQIENKHLKEEMDRLQRLLNGSNMQRDLMEKELCQITQQLNDVSKKEVESSLDFTKVMQENISLKKEIEKLKLQIIARNDYYQSLNNRASRQMNTLKDNWKKAENEIVQLETMLDICKKHVANIPESLLTHCAIRGLQELFID